MSLTAVPNDGRDLPSLADGTASTSVFVRNLDRKMSEQDILTFFSKFGKIRFVHKGPKSKTSAFVMFVKEVDASNVYQASSKELIFRKKQLYIQKPTRTSNLPNHNGADNHLHIHNLPNEILQHIFSFLDFKHRIEIELVCKRWRMIGKTIPWRWPTKVVLNAYRYKLDKPDISGFEACTDKIIVAILSRCNCNLKEVTLHSGRSLTYQSVDAVGKFCPTIRELNLVGFRKISAKCLKRLAQRCVNLRVLGLQSFYRLQDETLAAILEDYPFLEYLDISYNHWVTGDCLQFAGKNLQGLRMNMCNKLKSHALENLTRRCTIIKVLHLSNCQIEKNVLFKVFSHFQNTLIDLRLDSLDRSRTLEAITVLRNLEKLSAYGSGMNDTVLKSVAKNCVKLVELNIGSTFVSDIGLCCLAKSPCLKVLHIPFTKNITGEGIEALAAEGRLEKLDAKYADVLSPNERYGSLARFCANFHFLDVSANKQVSNKLVETFYVAVTSGFLKKPVKLVVQDTLVTKDVEMCNGLQVRFKAVY